MLAIFPSSFAFCCCLFVVCACIWPCWLRHFETLPRVALTLSPRSLNGGVRLRLTLLLGPQQRKPLEDLLGVGVLPLREHLNDLLEAGAA